MASLYPAALDGLSTDKTDDTLQEGDHPETHNDLADALNKVEAELGTHPSGAALTVKDRLEDIEAAQAAIDAAVAARQVTAEKGVANGYASLGADGKVPAGQLPVIGADPLDDFDAYAMALAPCQSYYKFRGPFTNRSAVANAVRDSKGAVHGQLYTASERTYIGLSRGLRWGSAAFDGGAAGADRIEFGDNYDFPGIQSFSLMLLLTKGAPNIGGTRYVMGKCGDTNPSAAYDSFVSTTEKFAFRRFDATGAADMIVGGTSLGIGQEYFVAVTYDGANLRLFVDGVADAAAVASVKVVQDVATAFTLGNLVVGGAFGFGGEVARLGVFSARVADADIAALQALRA